MQEVEQRRSSCREQPTPPTSSRGMGIKGYGERLINSMGVPIKPSEQYTWVFKMSTNIPPVGPGQSVPPSEDKEPNKENEASIDKPKPQTGFGQRLTGKSLKDRLRGNGIRPTNGEGPSVRTSGQQSEQNDDVDGTEEKN